MEKLLMDTDIENNVGDVKTVHWGRAKTFQNGTKRSVPFGTILKRFGTSPLNPFSIFLDVNFLRKHSQNTI